MYLYKRKEKCRGGKPLAGGGRPVVSPCERSVVDLREVEDQWLGDQNQWLTEHEMGDQEVLRTEMKQLQFVPEVG